MKYRLKAAGRGSSVSGNGLYTSDGSLPKCNSVRQHNTFLLRCIYARSSILFNLFSLKSVKTWPARFLHIVRNKVHIYYVIVVGDACLLSHWSRLQIYLYIERVFI